MSEQVTPGDERDTSKGRCDAALSISGAAYRCDLAVDHNGWAHSSSEAGSIWSDASRVSPVTLRNEGLANRLRSRDVEVIEAAPSDTDGRSMDITVHSILNDWPLTHRVVDELITEGFSRSQPVQVEVTDDTFTRMMSSLDRLGRETIAALIAELNEVDADIRGELGTDVASRAASALAAALGGGDQ